MTPKPETQGETYAAMLIKELRIGRMQLQEPQKYNIGSGEYGDFTADYFFKAMTLIEWQAARIAELRSLAVVPLPIGHEVTATQMGEYQDKVRRVNYVLAASAPDAVIEAKP